MEMKNDRPGTELDTQVFRNMLDRVEGETELFADDDPSLAQKEGTYGTYRRLRKGKTGARLNMMWARAKENG